MKALLASILGRSEIEEKSSTLVLSQSYPNPFNSQVTVEFSLPERKHVTLTVYNVLGQVVFRPIEGEYLESGLHQYNLDFATCASGTYFYRIQTESGAIVRKMLLLK